MFTGIIEEVGRLDELRVESSKAALKVAAHAVLQDLKIGDSIAVNGVCLTATRISGGFFSADLSEETLARSSFRQAREGALLNLERPLTPSARLGGHFVQGHVDGIGHLASSTTSGEGAVMTFTYPAELARYLVVKGSISVHGVSLTVASLEGLRFSVAVIPHTLAATNLGQLRAGDPVNLEADILAKYFERFFQLGLPEAGKSRLTAEYLQEQGILMMRASRTILTALLTGLSCYAIFASVQLPTFGKDTVLVWSINNQDDTAKFVVRIAEFLPDRFVEWEDAKSQGTILMTNNAILKARTFVNARLFEAGVDTRGKDLTTLWLSRRIYVELKEEKRSKVAIDSVEGWMTVQGQEEITVEVNRTPLPLPVIRVKDDRGSERWFLDSEENPLMVKHSIRSYTKVLTSITTDRPNTLRWIKGKKLQRR